MQIVTKLEQAGQSFAVISLPSGAASPLYVSASPPNSAWNFAHTLSSTGVAAARIFASSCSTFKLPIGLP